MIQPRVVLHDVHRSYVTGPPWRRSRQLVLRGLHLALRAGEILILRGANGCGKTTLLRVLAGLVAPDLGQVEVCGGAPHSAPLVRARIGLSGGDERGLFRRLTGRHNLEFFASLHGLSRHHTHARIAELSDELGLADVLDCRVDRCSSGMAARLSLARALLHAPDVLLLDEPTKSLDEQHRQAFRTALARRARNGAVVVLATHSAEDAPGLDARTAILSDGVLQEEQRHTNTTLIDDVERTLS